MALFERGLGPETKAIVDAVRSTEDMEERYSTGVWRFERVGKTDIYKVYIAADARYILMTGANVTTQLSIPFPHRWLRIHFYHTQVAGLPAMGYLRISLRREVNTFDPNLASDELFCEFNINQHVVQEQFGEGWEYEAGVWTLILNTALNERVAPLFYIQKLKTVGK